MPPGLRAFRKGLVSETQAMGGILGTFYFHQKSREEIAVDRETKRSRDSTCLALVVAFAPATFLH